MEGNFEAWIIIVANVNALLRDLGHWIDVEGFECFKKLVPSKMISGG